LSLPEFFNGIGKFSLKTLQLWTGPLSNADFFNTIHSFSH